MASREQVTGNFGGDEVVLNNAATEATLEKLLRAVEKRSDTSDKEAKKLKEELVELKKKSDDAGESLGKVGDAASRAASSIGRGFGHTADAAVGLTKEFVTGSMRISDFTSHLTGFINQIPLLGPILGGPLQLLAGFVDKNVDTFRELSTVGVDFGESIFSAQSAATRSGLALSTFSQTVGQNSEALALLAGDASSGAEQFRNISRRVQDSAFRFANLGLTLDETAAYTADYLDMQTRLGRAQELTDRRLGNQTTDYIEQLDQLARVTGQQRDQISEQLKQQALDKRLQGILATMEGETKENLQGVLTTLESQSPAIADAFKNMVATGGVPVTDFGRDLLRTNDRLGSLARGLREGTVTYEEAMAEFRRSGEIANNLGQSNLRFTGTLAALGSEVGAASLELLGFTNIAEGATEAEQERLDAMNSGSKAFASFEAALTQTRNEILGQLINSGAFEKLEGAFAKFTEYVTGDGLDFIERQITRFSVWFNGWMTRLENDEGTLGDMLADAGEIMIEKIQPLFVKLADAGIKALGTAIKEMFSSPVVTGAIIGFFAAPMLLKKAGSALAAGITSLFTGRSIKNTLANALKALVGANVVKSAVSDTAGAKDSSSKKGKGAAGSGGKFGKFARTGLGRATSLVGVGLTATDAYTNLTDDDTSNNKSAYGGIAGTVIGGALGAFGGIPGAMLGASLGGLAGQTIGELFNSNDSDTKKRVQSAAEAQVAASITDEQLSRLDALVELGPKVENFSRSMKGLQNTFKDLDFNRRELYRAIGSINKLQTSFDDFTSRQIYRTIQSLEQFSSLLDFSSEVSNTTRSLDTLQTSFNDLDFSGVDLNDREIDKISRSVNGLQTTFNDLDFNYREIDRTSRSLEQMAEKLEEINTQLAGGDKGFLDRFSRNDNENTATAGDVVSGIQNNTKEELEKLNKIMTDVLGVLLQSNDMNRKQLTATRGLTSNIYRR